MFPHYIAYNLLFADLLHKFVYIQDAPYIIFIILIPFLIWQIGKHFFEGKKALIAPVIFILSPWFWYEAFAQSFYIFLFFLTLSIVYGLLTIHSGRKIPGIVIVSTASLAAMYTSSLFLILVPFLFLILVVTKITPIKTLKYSLIIIAILILPLVFFIRTNKTALKSSINQEIPVFSDPGLLNTVNRYQGAAMEDGFRKLARISENKYIFFSEYFANKYLNQLMPLTIFTPQYKLLSFSFSPPIFLGFLIPFAYGFYKLMHEKKIRNIIIISTILLVPSILSNQAVSLNRLILFSPVVIYIISQGLILLYGQRKERLAKIFFLLTVALVLFQIIVTAIDIKTREGRRFVAYNAKNYQMVEP